MNAGIAAKVLVIGLCTMSLDIGAASLSLEDVAN